MVGAGIVPGAACISGVFGLKDTRSLDRIAPMGQSHFFGVFSIKR